MFGVLKNKVNTIFTNPPYSKWQNDSRKMITTNDLFMNSGLEWEKITVRFAMRPKCFIYEDMSRAQLRNRRHSNQIRIGIIRQEPLIYFPVLRQQFKRIKNI
jgi:hypothetical protein